MASIPKKTAGSKFSVGLAGQIQAEAWLCARGLHVIARNHRTRQGEIDLIMHEGQTLVFVEVKSQRQNDKGSALEWVTPQKQKRLGNLALAYLKQVDSKQFTRIRFDVVRVGMTPRIDIQWIKNAFEVAS